MSQTYIPSELLRKIHLVNPTVDHERDLKDEDMITPMELNTSIRVYPHQLASLKRIQGIEDWMINPLKYQRDFFDDSKTCVMRGNMLILSDPVGTGKTLIVLLRLLGHKFMAIPKIPLDKTRIPYKKIKTYGDENLFIVNNDVNMVFPDYLNFDFINHSNPELRGLGIYKCSTDSPTRDASYFTGTRLIKTNLVIVPHSVLVQWEDAIKTFTRLTPDQYVVIKRKSDIPVNMMDLDGKILTLISFKQYIDVASVLMADCLTKKTLYVFSRTIIDEAHQLESKIRLTTRYYDATRSDYRDITLRFSPAFQFKSVFTWLVSSSFRDIFANHFLVRTFSLPKLLDYDGFRDILIMNDSNKIYRSMGLPDKREHYLISKFTPLMAKLDRLNRAGRFIKVQPPAYYGDDLSSLRKTIFQVDNVPPWRDRDSTSDLEKDSLKKLYQDALRRRINKLNDDIRRLPHLRLTAYRQERRRQELQMRIDEHRIDITSAEDFGDYETPRTSKLTEEWLTDQVFHNKRMDKRHRLFRLLQYLERTKPDFRAIIYAEYEGSFEYIKELLDENLMKYAEVKGTASHINKLLKSFAKEGDESPTDTRVLLLNGKFMGSGMNIQATTDVIIYHDVCLEQRRQIIGRAYRLGRKKPMDVWHLFYEQEVPKDIAEIIEASRARIEAELDAKRRAEEEAARMRAEEDAKAAADDGKRYLTHEELHIVMQVLGE